jgi:uncharacterized protein
MKAFSITALAAPLTFAGPTGPLQAQIQDQVGPSVEALEAARDLLVLMSRDLVAHLAGQVTTQMWPAIESRLRAYNSNIDAIAIAGLRKELDRIQFEYMMNIVAEGPVIYARHFTAQELREIIAFYRTPTGGKLLQLTPQLSAEVMGMVTPHMPEFYAQTVEAFRKVLRSRGYNL